MLTKIQYCSLWLGQEHNVVITYYYKQIVEVAGWVVKHYDKVWEIFSRTKIQYCKNRVAPKKHRDKQCPMHFR